MSPGKIIYSDNQHGFADRISINGGLKFAFMGFHGRHEVGCVSTGGEDRLYHYEVDKSLMIYLDPYVGGEFDLGVISVGYTFGIRFLLASKTRRQDLFVTYPEGSFDQSEFEKVGNYQPFNSVFTMSNVYVTIPLDKGFRLKFGHEWSSRSIFKDDLVWHPSAYPFRNFSVGIRYDIKDW